MGDEAGLVGRAVAGEPAAFDALVGPVVPALTAYVRRMIGHPEDARDLVQDTLLRAFESIAEFRGDARLETWLFAIATRRCIDHLRARKRWSWDAQEEVRRYLYETLGDEVREKLFPADYRFDAHEHIAFCFTCVGRSLDPVEQAALVLTEVLELGNRESARALGLSESVLRHRLSSARATMHERFEGLCALVNKKGVCHQCAGLRKQAAGERQGPAIPDLGGEGTDAEEKHRRRLAIVRDGGVHRGAMQPFHDTLWRALERFAEARHP
jgi:RNA polymerase sigma-70 factor (ECF subfamily)